MVDFCKCENTYDKYVELVIDDNTSKHYFRSICVECDRIKMKHIHCNDVLELNDLYTFEEF